MYDCGRRQERKFNMQPSERRLLPRFGTPPNREEAENRPRRWQRRHSVHRALFFGSFALLMLLAALSRREEDRRKHIEGFFVRSEQIIPSDYEFSDRSGRFDLWLIELIPGQTLRVEVTATRIVPHLRVVGPMATASPKILVVSDSSNSTTTSAEFSPDEPGEYGVIVWSEPDAHGPYQLRTNYRAKQAGGDDEIGGAAGVATVAMAFVWIAQYLGVFVMLDWRHPDRILLLRPFGQRRVSRALKRFNRRYLAYRGFTFTLADKHLRNSLIAYLVENIPTDFGSLATVIYRPLFRRLQRWVSVRRPRDLSILRLRLRSRWRLTNFWCSWLGLRDRINKFRSRDELWKDCIDILLDDCQVIVLDMSHAGEGTLWEIQELFRRGYGYKTVIIVRDDDEEERTARIALESALALNGMPWQSLTLYRYRSDNGRLVSPKRFEEAYTSAISSPQQPSAPPLKVSVKAVLSTVPMTTFGPFWLPVGLPLAVLALREIRRANGFLKGEVIAHLAIMIYGIIIIIAASFAGTLIFTAPAHPP
jgi:hypothetical protein